MCPGLTCSQEAESHTTEEPGAHGSTRNPRLLLAEGRAPGVRGVSADPPASLIGPLPMTSCSVPAGCFLIHWTLARSHGGLLYALPRPAQPLGKGLVWGEHCPHMPIAWLSLLFLSLPDTPHPALTSHTNPSPTAPHAAPGDDPWAHPEVQVLSPLAWAVRCLGWVHVSWTTQGTQTYFLMQACSQGSPKLPSPG